MTAFPQRKAPGPREADFSHTGTASTWTYGVNVPFMQLERNARNLSGAPTQQAVS